MKKIAICFYLCIVLGIAGCTTAPNLEGVLPTLVHWVPGKTATPLVPVTQTPIVSTPTRNPEPTMTIVQATAPCNLAAAGQPLDVTIPDDTRVKPGVAFTKVWRLKNIGSCEWTMDYDVVWFAAEQMGAENRSLPDMVAPGDSVDILLDMKSPQAPGIYQSYWKLRAPDGELFGIGPSGDGAFWARVEVVPELALAPPAATLTPTTEPMILAFGSGSLSVLDEFDMDKGRVIADTDSDLRYQEQEGQMQSLQPINDARIMIYGVIAPSITACQTVELSVESIAVEALFDGAYICYQTNKGFPGFIRVDTVIEDQISFEFLTWALP